MAHINVNPRTMTIVQARQKRDDLHPTASTGGGQGGAALQQEITMLCEQVEEQTCMSVERPDLINEIQKILNNLRNDPEVYKVEPEGESGVSTPERGPLWPIISLLKTISTLMMGDPQILHQIRSEIDDLGLLCDEIISGRCWELEFHRSQASSLMEKSRLILDEFTKLLFDGLIVRVHNQAKNSRQKAAITKLVDGFKDCCYLELEVKVTDLLTSIEPKETTSNVGNVVVRILGSWEIKEVAGEVMTLPQLIQKLSKQEQSFPPKVEDVLRRLQLQDTGENVQMPTQSTSRKRPIQAEEIEVESSSPIKRRRKDSEEVGSSSSLNEHEPIRTIWDDEKRREKMLKDILEKNLLLRKIVELCDESDTFNLPSILKRCKNWSLEYEHKYKPVQRNRNEEFYAERIRLYIQEKLQVDPNMMMSSALSKAEILIYLLNSDKGADNPVMALLCRIWKPLHSDAIRNVYELTCFLFSDDQIFDHFYHLLDQNWKALDHVLKKNIKEFILNDQSHFLVEQLLRTTEIGSTSTSASTMHSYPLENLRWLLTETRDPTRLSQATHLFQTPTFEPYIKIFKEEHVKALYSLLAFENSKKQTALHTNANCIARIIIHTYVPRYRNDIEELLAKMDPSEGTPVNNKKQGSPNVLIIASESGKADALSRDFKEAGMNVYNVYKYEPLQTDKQQMEEIVVHIKRIFEQNDTPPSGLFVVFLATGVKEGTRTNQLRQIERAMCESKANEGRCIPKILITDCIDDCEPTDYWPTYNHFCAILFSGRRSAQTQLDHKRADFLEEFIRLLGTARPGLSLESLFNTASSQMSNEGGFFTPIMLSRLATDYYPLRGGLSASVSSSTQTPDVSLLSWTREQVSKNRYIMHDNPTVLIIYTTHDRPGAEEEASLLSDAFESTNRYKIKVQPDKSVEKILQFIEESATETDKYSNMQPSALIVIIMSRGNFSHGELEDCDRNSFNVNSVMEAMCQENLTDRPKILITQFTQTKNEEEYDDHLEIPPESVVTLARFTGENASQKSFINELAEQILENTKDLNKIIVDAGEKQKRTPATIQNLKESCKNCGVQVYIQARKCECGFDKRGEKQERRNKEIDLARERGRSMRRSPIYAHEKMEDALAFAIGVGYSTVLVTRRMVAGVPVWRCVSQGITSSGLQSVDLVLKAIQKFPEVYFNATPPPTNGVPSTTARIATPSTITAPLTTATIAALSTTATPSTIATITAPQTTTTINTPLTAATIAVPSTKATSSPSSATSAPSSATIATPSVTITTPSTTTAIIAIPSTTATIAISSTKATTSTTATLTTPSTTSTLTTPSTTATIAVPPTTSTTATTATSSTAAAMITPISITNLSAPGKTFNATEFMVKEIRGKRKRKGKNEYLVLWEGFGEDDVTWEPAKHLKNNMRLTEFQKKIKKGN